MYISIFKRLLLDRNFFLMFVLAIVSGMPFAILVTAMSTWMTELGIALLSIGLFSSARTPYSLKYLWSPLIDHIRLPILHKYLGRRRSWMLFINLLLVSMVCILAYTDPRSNLMLTWYAAFMICFFAATFDIVWDAFRIESLPEELQGIGSAVAVSGYRVGMLISSAGSMYFATYYGWESTFLLLAGLLLLGSVATLLMKEPSIQLENHVDSILSWKMCKQIFLDPLTDFFRRSDAVLILSIVILYKLGEAFLGAMLNPFYIQLGFTKPEIASITKLFGLLATLSGAYIGGLLMLKYSNLRTLLICGIGQMLSNLIFVWQNYMGHDIWALTVSISVENITGGMGNAALIGYMSNLCSKKYTATHYALLTSFAAVATSTLASSSGKFAEMMGWDMFFVFTTIISLPALLLIRFLTVN
jgi:PAT family beta-lactamase induction signal transducer AmpG